MMEVHTTTLLYEIDVLLKDNCEIEVIGVYIQ
jgi:hypothetical protein